MNKIAIIGAGAVGGALAGKLVALGYDVTIANSRGPNSLRDVEARTGAKAVDLADTLANAELAIVAIPTGRIPALGDAVKRSLPPGAILVDAGNYYPERDGHIAELDHGTPESAWVSAQLGRPVVKAFNNIVAGGLLSAARPSGAADRVALPVAGDDDQARSAVMRLIDALGFDTLDAGSLATSWRQQPGQPAYCTNPTLNDLSRLLDRADRTKGSINRDKGMKLMAGLPPGFPSHRLVQVARLSAGLDAWKPASWFAALTLAWAILRSKAGTKSPRSSA